MSNTKPREFWIYYFNSGKAQISTSEVKLTDEYISEPSQTRGIKPVEVVRVIEHSAYQAAQEEIEDLKASIAHQEEILSYIQKVPTEPNEKALAKRVVELEAKVARYEGALLSISKNSCCEPCQQAKLVARQALGDK